IGRDGMADESASTWYVTAVIPTSVVRMVARRRCGIQLEQAEVPIIVGCYELGSRNGLVHWSNPRAAPRLFVVTVKYPVGGIACITVICDLDVRRGVLGSIVH